VSTRVEVRPARASDAELFLTTMRASTELHHPWTVAPRTRAEFDALLSRATTGTYVPLLAFERATGLLAGYFALSEIVRRSFQNAYLGYYATAAGAGRGLMTEALRDVLGHAFGDLGLHRVEANVQPDNTRSLALVARAGFRREGFSPRYLNIGGVWCDHERWAMTVEDWRGLP
jgi:[ribosomal protein S5]-alanine N-acetyltransferase